MTKAKATSEIVASKLRGRLLKTTATGTPTLFRAICCGPHHRSKERVAVCPGYCFIEARFLQKCIKLSVPPKSVVKLVESTSKIFPERGLLGGIQSRQLNAVLPASVKGCGRSRSIGWRASRCTDLFSVSVIS